MQLSSFNFLHATFFIQLFSFNFLHSTFLQCLRKEVDYLRTRMDELREQLRQKDDEISIEQTYVFLFFLSLRIFCYSFWVNNVC